MVLNMKCILRGSIGSAVAKAEFLNNSNIEVYMEDGEIVFSSRKKLVEGLSILYVNDLITDEELLTNLKQYKTEKETNLKVIKNNEYIYLRESNEKFLCFAHNNELDQYFLVCVDQTEKTEKENVKFSFSEGTICYDIIDTLFKVDSSPIIQKEGLEESSRLAIEKDENSYSLNVIRKKDKTYMSKYTTLLSFNTSSSKSRIRYLYNELEKISINDKELVNKMLVK